MKLLTPIKLALEANANVKDKKLTEASELYEKLVEHYTIGTKICSAMTMIYVAQESAKDVFQCEVTLIEINSFNIMAHLNKGYILREQGKLNEALKCYNIAIELNLEYAKKCHEDNANVIANNPLADKYYESLIVRNDSCDKKSHLMGDSLYKETVAI
jgi:tetratricopeptide (TPR) repeat protein